MILYRRINCSGEEELKMALAKISESDWISLLDGAFVPGGSQLSLPPPEMVSRIKAFAREHELQIN